MSHIGNDKERQQNIGKIIFNIVWYSFFVTEIVLLFYFFQQGYIVGWKGILLAFLYVFWSIVCIRMFKPEAMEQGAIFFIIEIQLSRHMFAGSISKIIGSTFIMIIVNLVVKGILAGIHSYYYLEI